MSRFMLTICRSQLQTVARAVYEGNGANVIGARVLNSLNASRQLHLSSARNGSAGEGFHRTSDFDKKILVWTKMYPDVGGVPDEVTNTKMKKAKDMFRIRVNIMMALATVLLCVGYIISGKRAVERGENISKQNRDRHFEFQGSNK